VIPEPVRNLQFYPASGVRFTLVLKNACTTVMATLLTREGVVVDGSGVDEVHALGWTYGCGEDQPGRRLVVLRDPAERFVSGVLHQVVLNERSRCRSLLAAHRVWALWPDLPRGGAGPVDLDRVTVLDVARAVALIADDELEGHLRSQSWAVAGRDHDEVVVMGRPGWQTHLAEVSGAPLVPVLEHATGVRAAPVGTFGDATAVPLGALRAHAARTGLLPAAVDLLTDEVRGLLARRFAADERLLAAHR